MDSYCISHSGVPTDGTISYSITAPTSVRGPHLAFVRLDRSGGLLQRTISHMSVNCGALRVSRVGTRKACHKDADEAHVSRRTRHKQGSSVATSTSESNWKLYSKNRRGSLWLSEAAATEAEVRLEPMTMDSVVATNLVAEKVHDNSYFTEKTLASYDLNFADTFHSISQLYAEVSEDSRQVAEYLQHVDEEGKGLRTTSDYNRRAYLYERVAEIVQAGQKKGEKVCEDLEQLQEVVMEEDRGRSPADYRRRAELFSKSAEVFGIDNK